MFLEFVKNKIGQYKLNALKKSFAFCGENFKCVFPITIISPRTLTIGNDVFISHYAHISSCEGSYIGDGVMIGPFFIMETNDHIFDMVGKTKYQMKKEKKRKPIIIEQDVWIGARVTILKGVIIGEGSVIGAGSVVNRNIPPYTVNVGVPAKPVKKIFDDGMLRKHLLMMGKSEEVIEKIVNRRSQMLGE